MDYFLSSDVAKIKGVHVSSVSRAAKRLKIGQVRGPLLYFSPAEFAEICSKMKDSPGNPRSKFIAGNDLWKRRKKDEK